MSDLLTSFVFSDILGIVKVALITGLRDESADPGFSPSVVAGVCTLWRSRKNLEAYLFFFEMLTCAVLSNDFLPVVLII